MTAIDTLYKSVEKKGVVCVGLDTNPLYIPKGILKSARDEAQAVYEYNCEIVDATSDISACYKVQIAYYEALGIKGLEAYSKTLSYIRSKKLIVIADIKRSDIESSASHYVKAHFSGDFEADFVTLSPYMGMDSIKPWIEEAYEKDKGFFVVMRTTNEGRKDFQCKKLLSGKTVYEEVGDKMHSLSLSFHGECGYGIFGVVVGCTGASDAASIRKEYKELFFLIPGYGAQGGECEDASLLLDDKGNGGVVNSSRSILTAWKKEEAIDNMPREMAVFNTIRCVRDSVLSMREGINNALQYRI